MKDKYVQAFLCFCFCGTLFGQKKVYQHTIGNTGAAHTVTVKGENFGKYGSEEVFYEKIDAINHKYKTVEFDIYGKVFDGMNSYQINETLLSVTNLRVKEEKSGGKTWYVVNIKPLNDKKPIEYKIYNTSTGAFNNELGKRSSLDVPFPTKAKAEAFIADLQTLFK